MLQRFEARAISKLVMKDILEEKHRHLLDKKLEGTLTTDLTRSVLPKKYKAKSTKKPEGSFSQEVRVAERPQCDTKMTSSNGSKGTRTKYRRTRPSPNLRARKVRHGPQLVDSVVLDTSLLQMLHRQDV